MIRNGCRSLLDALSTVSISPSSQSVNLSAAGATDHHTSRKGVKDCRNGVKCAILKEGGSLKRWDHKA